MGFNGAVTSSAPGRLYGGVSPEERRAKRLRQILDAGLEIFGTEGYRAATVRGLCREAKVADRYFYESFDHTEDLLVAVYHECIDRIRDAVVAAVGDVSAGADPLEAARRGFDAFFAAAEDRRLARVVWLEVLGVSPRVEDTYRRTIEGFGDLLMDLAIGMGLPVGVEPTDRLLVLATVGGVNQLSMSWQLENYATEREHLVEASMRLLNGVILAISERSAAEDGRM